MTRYKRLKLTPTMLKNLDTVIGVRTSPLCRDEKGQLIAPPECNDNDDGETDEESAAVYAIVMDWYGTFTDAKLASLRNGD